MSKLIHNHLKCTKLETGSKGWMNWTRGQEETWGGMDKLDCWGDIRGLRLIKVSSIVL